MSTPLSFKGISAESSENGLNRRNLLKGLTLFLGASSCGLGGLVLEGCTQDIPPELLAQTQHLQPLIKQWSPPAELLPLGEKILSKLSHITPETSQLVQQLETDLQLVAYQKLMGNKAIQAKEIAQHLHQIHLKSAREGHWFDIEGWRLTRVEASVYALLAIASKDSK